MALEFLKFTTLNFQKFELKIFSLKLDCSSNAFENKFKFKVLHSITK